MKVSKVLLVIILVFIIAFSINKFMLSIERNKIVDYGEKIKIRGKNINIVGEGLENDQVVIIDPGYGTIAPGLDFISLMDGFSQTCHVVMIGPFRYDDSDTIGGPRTVENITDGLHQVIQKLGYTKYILCSHSISGVYSLYYSDKYQSEVTGFIGVGTSIPNQLEYTGNTFLPILREWSNKLGLTRIASRIHPEWFMADNQYCTDETKSQIRYKLYKDFANADNLGEGRRFANNWNKIKDLHYPRDIKKIFFLTKKEGKDKGWRYIETQNTFERITVKCIWWMEIIMFSGIIS